jgi:nucleoside 2-deoxyribosyltransferase
MANKKKGFVIMPFRKETETDRNLQRMYQLAIKPALELEGYECIRADEIQEQGLVLEHIVQAIDSADVVIADLTNDNPNVMYELGLAHARSKPVIMIAQNPEKAPFDLKAYRIVKYGTNLGEDADLKKEIRGALRVVGKKEKSTNPVVRFLRYAASSEEIEKQQKEITELKDLNMKLEGKTEFIDEFFSKLRSGTLLDELKADFDKNPQDESVAMDIQTPEGRGKLTFTKVPESKKIKVNLRPIDQS